MTVAEELTIESLPDDVRALVERYVAERVTEAYDEGYGEGYEIGEQAGYVLGVKAAGHVLTKVVP
jgi:flagellar biosynthesis/type III secretory pathway protein FliH